MASDDQATRKRILDHAAALFAERGFEKVTVREICRGARANVAAVNYHFGDKRPLYVAVVKMAIEIMRETNELSVEAGRGASPDDQLRAYVRVFLTRLMSTGRNSWIHKLMTHELESPSDAFDLVIRDVIEPRQQVPVRHHRRHLRSACRRFARHSRRRQPSGAVPAVCPAAAAKGAQRVADHRTKIRMPSSRMWRSFRLPECVP